MPLQDFMTAEDEADVTGLIETLSLHSNSITEEQAVELSALVCTILPEQEQYDADFSFTDELSEQIKAIRAMRKSVITAHGQVREGASVREVKEVVSASSTMLQTLLKTHDQVQSFERQRAIEKAVIDTVKSLPQEYREKFFAELEIEMEKIQ